MKSHGFSRILLATDGSDEADAATGVAAWMAHASGAVVRVVHVWNLELQHRHGVWDVEARTEAEKLISEAVSRFRGLGIEADGQLSRADNDHVAAAIAEVAHQFGADLVVVGSRGLSDWQAMRRHSVSHQLLGAVDCPVLIVRASGLAAQDARRVTLAIAGGDDIAPAVHAAIAAAAAPGSKVLVVHVAQAIVGVQGFAYFENEEEIEATVEKAVTMLKDAGVDAESTVLQSGPVARAVAETAAKWQADVIVIGSSRMSDLGSIVFGSVTHELLRATDRPVLIAERIKA